MKNLLLACALSVAALAANAESVATGNLNYSISQANGEVVLTLINKTPDVPAILESVGLLFPGTGDGVHSPRKINRTLDTKTEIALGGVDAFANLVSPGIDLRSWKPFASDRIPNCRASECETKPFAVKLSLKYSNTVSQELLLGGFVQYSR